MLIFAIAFGIAFGLLVRKLMLDKHREQRTDHNRLMRDIRNSPPVDDGVNDL